MGGARTEASVIFRNPFPPHEALAAVDASSISYSHLLLKPSTASFQVRVGDANLEALQHQFGAMVSIERDDGLFPWIGMVTKRHMDTGNTMIQFEAKDHAGALFARAKTPENLLEHLGTWWQLLIFREGDAASQIKTVLGHVDQENSPPLLVGYDLDSGGPHTYHTPEGESVLDYLQELHDITGWEWGLRHNLSFGAASAQLVWHERIGKDLRGDVIWEEGRHFERLKFTQDASKFMETVTVISVGIDDREDLLRAKSRHARRQTLPPVLRGSELVVKQSTKDLSTLQAEADRLANDPTNRGEHVGFSVVESEINELITPNPGDLIRIRFQDSGVNVERSIRILGTQHRVGSGVIDIEADVEEEEDGYGNVVWESPDEPEPPGPPHVNTLTLNWIE